MSDTKRVIIGSESDDSLKLELQQLGSKVVAPVALYNSSGVIIDTFTAIISGTVTVSATDLDIRDLTSSDVVTVTGGASQTADVKVSLDGETVTVDTELPASVALSDTLANPTAPAVGGYDLLWDGTQWVRARGDVNGGANIRPYESSSADADDLGNSTATLQGSNGNPIYVRTFGHWFDGSTWDRARGDSTDGLLVNLGANNDVTVTGTITANQGTAGSAEWLVGGGIASGATDSGNPVKIGGIYNSTKPTFIDGQRGDVQITSRGAVTTTLFVNDTGTAITAEADNADNVAASGTGNNLSTVSRLTYFDGSTWDRARGDSTDGLLINLGTNNDVTVSQDSQASLDHGSNLDIDTIAEQITSTSFSAKRGVILRCPLANTGTVYVGNSDVTAGTTAATDGIPIESGESLFLEVNNPNLLYAIGSANNQTIFWLAV